MVRSIAVALVFTVSCGNLPATEPLQSPTSGDRFVLTRLAVAQSLLQRAEREFATARDSYRERVDDERRKATLVSLADCETAVTKARGALRDAVLELRLLAFKATDDGDEWRAEWFTKLAGRTQRVIGDSESRRSTVSHVLTGLGNLWKSCGDRVPAAPDESIASVTEGFADVIVEVGAVFRDLDQSLSKEYLAELLRGILENQKANYNLLATTTLTACFQSRSAFGRSGRCDPDKRYSFSPLSHDQLETVHGRRAGGDGHRIRFIDYGSAQVKIGL